MNDNRLGGLALILGAVSGLVTLTFHPGGGGHPLTPAQFEMLIGLIIGIHALAITGLPISFAGAVALTRQIESPLRLGLLGLVLYGFGLVAMMAAATLSGLVTPEILRHIVTRSPASDQWQTLMTYNHSINQGFARVGAVSFSIAILLWSILIWKRRILPAALGVYGMVSAIGVLVALFGGLLDLELHGFRIITLVQALWLLVAGVSLWRINESAIPTPVLARA
jgi:heme A synthase